MASTENGNKNSNLQKRTFRSVADVGAMGALGMDASDDG
jgi:hypothetical protein